VREPVRVRAFFVLAVEPPRAALALEGLVAESQGDEASSRRKQAPTQSDSNSSSSQYDTLGRYVSADGSRKKLWED